MRPAPTRIQPESPYLQPTVLKFGGTSVGDKIGFQRVQQIVRDCRDRRPVVVVSAMSGITDLLIRSFRAAQSGDIPLARQILEAVSSRHLAVARELLVTRHEASARETITAAGEISALLDAAVTSGNASALEDLVCSYGERLAAGLLTAVLLENDLAASFVDARLCIRTDSNHGNAKPLIDESEVQTRVNLAPVIDELRIPVLGGFIGMSEDGKTTTLGRNGSDYTASIVGSALKAREIQIWSDVPGMMTADPRLVSDARRIAQLSYAEAAELAHFGAKVLHYKMIPLAARRRIPVLVRNTFGRGVSGTLVCSQDGESTTRIKAIAHKKDMIALRLTPYDLLFSDSQIDGLRNTLRRHRVEIYAVAASVTSATLLVDSAAISSQLTDELNETANVTAIDECDAVFIIGGDVSCVPEILKRLNAMFAGSEPELPLQSTHDRNLILAVARSRTAEVVTRLHSIFVDAAFG